MIRTAEEIVIRAPIDRVYAAGETKGRFAEFMPHVLESVALPGDGPVRYRMKARMKIGLVSRWISERTGGETNRYADFCTMGFCRHMEGRWAYEALPPEADGRPRTRVTLSHRFEVGHPILRLLVDVDRIVLGCVEDNARKMLEALRLRLEA